MPPAKCSPEEFAAIWQSLHGHTPSIAKAIGCDIRNVMKRRHSVEQQLGVILASGSDRTGRTKVSLPKIGHRVVLDGIVGTVIVFSDPHWWPHEDRSPAFRALVQLCKDLKPVALIADGDLFDGARVSRFPTGWTSLPTVKDEIDIVHQRLSEISEAVPPNSARMWAMGNHDSRMSLRLAQVAPEFEGVRGLDLKDHFDDLGFEYCWSVLINGNLFIKHRFRGGEHAAWNNTIRAGVTTVTGHDHTLKVSPFVDINGLRWGVTCGTLSQTGSDVAKFAYQEDNPSQANQGFAVFTIAEDGVLLPPEICQVINDKAWFRGKQVTPGVKVLKKKAA